MRLALGFVLLIIALGFAGASDANASYRPLCQEDERCWNWVNHGNHTRGVATLDGDRRRVVGPCTFARLAHGGYIDWSRTKRMRGDVTARRLPCPNYRPIPARTIF